MDDTREYVEHEVVALEAELAEPTPRTGVGITALATGLWVVVGSLLAYGIVMTAIKASALFTG